MFWPTKKLGEQISNFLFGFSFVKEITGSYNRNFFLKRNITGSKWHGKISLKLSEFDFEDLNNRAILAYRLSKLIDAGLPQSKIMSIKRVLFPDNFQLPQNAVDDKIFITKFEGVPIKKFKIDNFIDEIKNLRQMTERINKIPEKEIKKTFRGLIFYRKGTREIINDIFVKFLLERRENLNQKIMEWRGVNYPRKINI